MEYVLMEGTMALLARQSGSASGERSTTSKLHYTGRLTRPGSISCAKPTLYVVVHRKEEKDEVGMMSNASHSRER